MDVKAESLLSLMVALVMFAVVLCAMIGHAEEKQLEEMAIQARNLFILHRP